MIGIVGASGFIGFNLYKFLKNKDKEVIGTYFSTRKEGLTKFDLCSDNYSLFDNCNYVVLSNGITNIDECFLKKDVAYKINVEKTIELIDYLSDRNVKVIFLSSDQVFDGKRGYYTEEDEANPINHYGRLKLQIEGFMKKNIKDSLILRLSKTYSRNLEEGGMFAEIFLNLKDGKKVKAAYNQIFNPTEVKIVCEGIYKAIKMGLSRIYHLADERVMSRYDFATTIADKYGFDKSLIEPIDINGISLFEKRPLNSSLNVERMRKLLVSQ